jgi:hypothetical protein
MPEWDVLKTWVKETGTVHVVWQLKHRLAYFGMWAVRFQLKCICFVELWNRFFLRFTNFDNIVNWTYDLTPQPPILTPRASPVRSYVEEYWPRKWLKEVSITPRLIVLNPATSALGFFGWFTQCLSLCMNLFYEQDHQVITYSVNLNVIFAFSVSRF